MKTNQSRLLQDIRGNAWTEQSDTHVSLLTCAVALRTKGCTFQFCNYRLISDSYRKWCYFTYRASSDQGCQ